MPTYKLTYFNARGFGEISRLVFAQAGVDYEDIRFEREDWLKYKPKTPFGQAPVLDVDGFQIADSQAIARYLGKEFGMAGKNRQEEALVDMYAAAAYDLIKPVIPIFDTKDEKEKKELKKKYEETAPKFLDRFETTLGANSSEFLVGDGVTWADFALFNFIPFIASVLSPELYAKYPNVHAHSKTIEGLPKIAEWLKKRPVTET